MRPYLRMRDMPKEILHTMGKRLKMLRDNAEMDQRQLLTPSAGAVYR